MGCAWSAEAGRRLAGSGGRGASLRTFLSAVLQEKMDWPDSTPVYPRGNGGLGRTARSCITTATPDRHLRNCAPRRGVSTLLRWRGQRAVVRASSRVGMEAPSGFEPEMEVLQTSALPLGYGALSGSTTKPRVSGREKVERETGFEPATSTLARSHSTTELFPLANRLSTLAQPGAPTQDAMNAFFTTSTTGSKPLRHRTVTTSNRQRQP